MVVCKMAAILSRPQCVKDDKYMLNLQNLYHVFWYPSDTRSQGISRYSNDLVYAEYFWVLQDRC